ncbi:MAG: polysaccharide deacetylase family protein [Nanoarchaeota archaeon]|nr:polysaccharide deacetylase family protein [Nanoarchaeota archaeon]MBU1270363.1 polysaccharide deacetylase family protein [Nanoarchaeota archaeon]MBU1604678.1 polysaccharide deacetylase family protein [Nanoarchaeota archaeon]MBU2443360.1 polysaccharide deacetylase family protein [Nanoarchaeota archaeon]
MKKSFLFSLIALFVLLFLAIFAYASFYPSSQLFGKVVYRLDTDKKQVVLTFDDGPGEQTKQILNVLKEKNVSAIFFVVGQRALEKPEVVKRIVDEGHIVGIHTMTHSYLFRNNYYELSESKVVVENITGETITLFRPPYGFRIPKTIKTAEELNLTTITWSNFPRDYNHEGEEIISRVINNLEPGNIIVLHDGPGGREETLKSLPTLIDLVRARGFEFVRLS